MTKIISFEGPLTAMVNGRVTLVGVTSFGSECSPSFPPGYARVSFQKDWILANSDARNYQCNSGKNIHRYGQ